MSRQNNGNGTYVLNTFDVAGNLTLLENRKSHSSLLSSFTYTVDNVGNRLAITESVLGTDNTTYHNATVSYAYDNLYRLTSEHRVPANPTANNPAFWYEYQYDAAGNRLLLTQKDGAGNAIGTTASTYDAANKLLTAGNTTYTWDANGNQTGKTVNNVTTTYVWDYADSENLTDKMTALHDGVTMTFTTDADGFRRSLTKDGAVTHFLYDRRSNIPGLDPLIAELDATGATTQTYVHANGLLATRPSTLPSARRYHFEAIGSTRELTDGEQSVTDASAYEAFGVSAASQGGTPNPFRYVGSFGYYEDLPTGFILLGGRYLGAEAGVFTSVDSERDGWNWYMYARQNPLTALDPTGFAVFHNDRKWCGDQAKKLWDVINVLGLKDKDGTYHHKWCIPDHAKQELPGLCGKLVKHLTNLTTNCPGLLDKIPGCRNAIKIANILNNAICKKKPKPPTPPPLVQPCPKPVKRLCVPPWLQQALAAVGLAGVTVVGVVLVLNDGTVVGVLDNGALVPLATAATALIGVIEANQAKCCGGGVTEGGVIGVGARPAVHMVTHRKRFDQGAETHQRRDPRKEDLRD